MKLKEFLQRYQALNIFLKRILEICKLLLFFKVLIANDSYYLSIFIRKFKDGATLDIKICRVTSRVNLKKLEAKRNSWKFLVKFYNFE